MVTVYETPGVYIQEPEQGARPIQGVGTAVAAFVGFTAKAPGGDDSDPEGLRPRLVTNWTQFKDLYGGFAPGAMLPHAVYGYFNNGGGRAYVVRVPGSDDGEEEPAPAMAELAAAAQPGRPALRVHATEGGEDLQLVVEAGQAVVPDDEPDAVAEDGEQEDQSEGDQESGAPPTFTIRVRQGGRRVESHENLTAGPGDRNVATVVNAGSERIRIEQLIEDPAAIPAAGTFSLQRPAVVPSQVSAGSFAGAAADRRGIHGLVIADDVTMVAVPDLITVAQRDGEIDLDLWKAVQQAMIDHCEGARNRMAILDAPPGMTAQDLAEWRSNEAMFDSAFAAMYWPFISVRNPTPNGDNDTMIAVPPSGHIAGVWARNDSTRGVHKAPANEVVRGALDVATKITDGEQGVLNPIGVNCIRPFGVRGIRVWGARTLSSDVLWRYVSVRRLFNFVEESVRRNTNWVVFEPNDAALWQRVKRTLNGFLYELWLGGALLGATPDQAYFVKCDDENNPPTAVEKGMLTVDVGLAALRPAEFVVFRFAQLRDESTSAG